MLGKSCLVTRLVIVSLSLFLSAVPVVVAQDRPVSAEGRPVPVFRDSFIGSATDSGGQTYLLSRYGLKSFMSQPSNPTPFIIEPADVFKAFQGIALVGDAEAPVVLWGALTPTNYTAATWITFVKSKKTIKLDRVVSPAQGLAFTSNGDIFTVGSIDSHNPEAVAQLVHQFANTGQYIRSFHRGDKSRYNLAHIAALGDAIYVRTEDSSRIFKYVNGQLMAEYQVSGPGRVTSLFSQSGRLYAQSFISGQTGSTEIRQFGPDGFTTVVARLEGKPLGQAVGLAAGGGVLLRNLSLGSSRDTIFLGK